MVRKGEYVEAGDEHVDIGGMGRYRLDEIDSSIESHRSEGDDEGVRNLSHLQGALFDNRVLERSNRKVLMNRRIRTSGRGKLGQAHTYVAENSTIPTSHLQPRDPLTFTGGWGKGQSVERPETRLVSGSGRYRPEKIRNTPERDPNTGIKTYRKSIEESDAVNVAGTGFNPKGTLVHEMGHRHHISSYPRDSPAAMGSTRSSGADAMLEAHADAYVDRYLRSNVDSVRDYRERRGGKQWAGLESTGYSTNFKGDRLRGEQWSPVDTALYAAARAHAGATGELVPYRPTKKAPPEADPMSGGPSSHEITVDATLHHLLSTSQHAKQALRQTSQTQNQGKKNETKIALKGVGAEAFRRHRDRQLLKQGQEIQESLWDDPNLSYNQFGEKPRTVNEVEKTLNIRPLRGNPVSALRTNPRGLVRE